MHIKLNSLAWVNLDRLTLGRNGAMFGLNRNRDPRAGTADYLERNYGFRPVKCHLPNHWKCLEQMEASTWLEKLVGNGSVGVVLKEISLEVHGGELMAILGSKGQLLEHSYWKPSCN